MASRGAVKKKPNVPVQFSGPEGHMAVGVPFELEQGADQTDPSAGPTEVRPSEGLSG
jgi:hypothetical protein